MNFFERAALVIPLSVITIDLIILLLNKIGILIRGPVLIGSVLIFCLLGYIVFQFRFNKVQTSVEENIKDAKLFDFTTWQTAFIVVSIFSSFSLA